MSTSTISVMISSTAQYALRAALFLASGDGGFVSRSKIAEAATVPHDYLLKVLNELDSAGIVESRRGPGGGYRLTASPADITVLQIVLVVDSIPRFTTCPLGIPGHAKLCSLHQLLDDASRSVEKVFGETTLEDLIPKRRRPQTCEFPFQSGAKR